MYFLMVISDKPSFVPTHRMKMPGRPFRGYFTYVILEPLNSISLPFKPMTLKSAKA
jgi:hypothetical protein